MLGLAELAFLSLVVLGVQVALVLWLLDRCGGLGWGAPSRRQRLTSLAVVAGATMPLGTAAYLVARFGTPWMAFGVALAALVTGGLLLLAVTATSQVTASSGLAALRSRILGLVGSRRPARPVSGAQPVHRETVARLEFDLLAQHRRRLLTEETPGHARGGDWTVLECQTRTAPPARFLVAERSPERRDERLLTGEGRLWVPSKEDGWRLALAVRAAFPEPEAGPVAAVGGSLSMVFETLVFGRNVEVRCDGSLGDWGTWTAMRWLRSDGAEFYLNFSPREKRGHLLEKGSGKRGSLHACFATLDTPVKRGTRGAGTRPGRDSTPLTTPVPKKPVPV